MSATILLVDPDIRVHQSLMPCIAGTTHELLCAHSAQQALAILDQEKIDLIVTEITLPDMSGFLFLNQVKHIADVIVYAQESHEELVLRAFEEGAGDFVSKSVVSLTELFYRVRAILRRRKPVSVSLKNIYLDIHLQCAWWKGIELELTRQSFQFLLELSRHPNIICTRDKLLSVIDSGSRDMDYRILYVIAYNLRQQIEENPDNPQYLLNVRGVGYIFRP